jgi:hypothetical protein
MKTIILAIVVVMLFSGCVTLSNTDRGTNNRIVELNLQEPLDLGNLKMMAVGEKNMVLAYEIPGTQKIFYSATDENDQKIKLTFDQVDDALRMGDIYLHVNGQGDLAEATYNSSKDLISCTVDRKKISGKSIIFVIYYEDEGYQQIWLWVNNSPAYYVKGDQHGARVKTKLGKEKTTCIYKMQGNQ